MNRLSLRILVGTFLATLAAMFLIHRASNVFFVAFFSDPSWYPVYHSAELVQQIFENTPVEEIAREKEYLESVLNRRIEVLDGSDETVPGNIRQLAAPGGLVYGATGDGRKLFFAQVHNGSYWVLIDPSFQNYKPMVNPLGILISRTAMFVAALITACWLSFPITRRLRALEKAAEKIRKGDVTTRIPDTKTDLIGIVGRCFNDMAERIQALVTGRQTLLYTVAQKFGAPIVRIDGHLKALYGEHRIPRIKKRSRKIDEAVNDIEVFIRDLLTNEMKRSNPGHRASVECGICETARKAEGKRRQTILNSYGFSQTPTRTTFQAGVKRFVLRISFGILMVLVAHQLLMLAMSQIVSKYIDTNPAWYPAHTTAALIQRIVERTHSGGLPDRLEALRESLDRRIDVVPSEAARHFTKTSGLKFAGGLSYGAYDGREVFFAPIHSGENALILDPGFYKYRQRPSVLLHLFALIISFILTALFGVFLSLPIIRNLKKLADAIEKIRRGDLDARVDIPVNKPIGTLARCFNDMAERIQSLLDHQKHLLQAVAHEIRTPVSRIRFHLEMLADASDRGEIDQRTGDIEVEIEELNSLVEELLTFSKLDAMEARLTLAAIPLHDALSEIVAYHRKTQARVTIVLRNVPEKNLTLRVHPVYFKRAIQNILSNAVRHAQSSVTLCCNSVEGGVLIDILDDGPGIPVHAREIIFAPFSRLDGSRSRMSGGFGLGLAIVKRILSLHGGFVSIGDNFPRGATISTFWPAANCRRRAAFF